ncbi:MAG: 1-acyl-sn-glycerol-3-phosphate acyltransferase [Acaryochloridaceae cyanobacterium RU_4_10]|nr:1-acyl-sn-glycerol-3-phosphate acyltransferase [Acaryochloridaceae cyanobacterium RU_4_10]
MPKAIRQAKPPLKFLPPAFNPWVFRVIRALLPAWLKYKLQITSVDVRQFSRLIDLYQRFQKGQVRLLIAFRHPSTDDPFTMANLVWRMLPKAARRAGTPLSGIVHSHFIYDRGIPLWAGSLVTWVFPRLGGTPILRGKADRLGLKTARDLLANGTFPLSAAPEGGTNDHSELMGSLEPGVAQLGFWCAEDLHKAGRIEETLIVPIGIKYSYLQAPWSQLEAGLTQIEQACGLKQSGNAAGVLSDRQADELYGRILTLAEHLLDLTEQFYSRFHGCTFAPLQDISDCIERNERLNARLKVHLEVALQVAEERLGVKPQGSFVDRCRRLEQAGWDRIFREDIDRLSAVERGFADWIAEEASLALWHMRLAERLTVITGDYILQKPSAERFAEILIILWRITAWLQKDNPSQEILNLGPRRACLTIGEPISVTQRWPHYQENRRSAREAVQQLTQDLQQTLESLMQQDDSSR